MSQSFVTSTEPQSSGMNQATRPARTARPPLGAPGVTYSPLADSPPVTGPHRSRPAAATFFPLAVSSPNPARPFPPPSLLPYFSALPGKGFARPPGEPPFALQLCSREPWPLWRSLRALMLLIPPMVRAPPSQGGDSRHLLRFPEKTRHTLHLSHPVRSPAQRHGVVKHSTQL